MTGRAADPSYLGQVPMFSGCTPEQLDEVAGLGAVVDVPDGADVVREGDTEPGLYVIVSGTAIVLRSGRTLASLGAGDYFGELSLFDEAPRNATVRASSELSCILMTRDAFDRALDVRTIRTALLRGMAERIRQFDQRAYWTR